MTQQNHGSSYGSELAMEKTHTMNGGENINSALQGLESKQPAEEETVDAGLKSLDHCTFSNPKYL
jgi:hypothetical protein